MASSLGLGMMPGGSLHSDILNTSPPPIANGIEPVLRFIDELKSRGRHSVQTKNYRDADALYGKAIDVLVPLFGYSDATIVGGSEDAKDDTVEEKIRMELAVLHSNRSLVRLNMNRPMEAHDDALLSSNVYDPTYVKGHWRLGQACGALGRWDDARNAYEAALKLDPTNKALRKEADRASSKADENQGANGGGGGGGGGKGQRGTSASVAERTKTAKAESPKSNRVEKNTASSVSPSSESTNDQTKTNKTSTDMDVDSRGGDKDNNVDDDDDDESALFTKSDHVRGYKLVGNKKTSYFHRELSEDEKRLIGDIAPKRIDASSTSTSTLREPGSVPSPSSSSSLVSPMDTSMTEVQSESERSSEAAAAAAAAAAGGVTSAWNKAGTWEEKDVSQWAVDTIVASLVGLTYALPQGAQELAGAIVKVTDVRKLDLHGGGHASVACVRGKKKYIYEFGLEICWSVDVEGGATVCSGTMTFPDVDGTVCIGDGYDLSDFTVKIGGNDGVMTKAMRSELNRHVRDGGLRKVLHDALDSWVGLFKATY